MKRVPRFVFFERWLLPALIAAFTLADGLLHLRLDYLLFGGTVWGTPQMGGAGGPGGSGGPPGPPPGAPPPGASGPPHGGGNPFPLPLNEMFFLNFLAAIGLVVALWIAWRWLPRAVWLVDAAVAAFSAFSIWGWWTVGKPNPQNLGHLSKGIEVVLIVLVLAHAWLLLRRLGLRRPSVPPLRRRSTVQPRA